MIILPLPVMFLDLFMVLSVVSSLVILLLVIYTKSPLEFTIFPTLLLVTTIARIALSVASTRLILSQGASFEGKVVIAFADFVTSGNFVVGIVVFIIIIAFQMMVVTKGSTRVAEVAARFKLDSMPGKQMAIDADLNAGLIDEKEAVRRRTAIQDEADFYGSMDGATKFIQGDVRLALILVIVNVVVGFIIGVAQRGESASEALQNYIRFSIGEGLVGAIPGLLVSVATGIIVTRSISKENLGTDFSNQLLSNYKVLFIAAGFSLVLAFIPGFPTIWLLLTAVGLYFVGNAIRGAVKEGAVEEKTPLDEEKEEEERYAPEKMVEEVRVDPLEIELGYALIPLVNKAQGGDLLDRIKKMRKQIVLDLGLIVPNVRITDNMQLEADEYLVKINGDQVGGSRLRMKKLLAMNTGGSAEKLAGEETREPVFNLAAFWIGEEEKENAERKGYTIVDGPTIVATHLTELIKRNAGEILSRKDVKAIIDSVGKRNPTLTEEIKTANVKIGDIQRILGDLLSEAISIRNIETIIETICDNRQLLAGGQVDALSETVRLSLKRQISARYADEKKNLNVTILSNDLEADLMAQASEVSGSTILNLSPEILGQLLDSVGSRIRSMAEKGYKELLLVDPTLRKSLRRILRKSFPDLRIMSMNEVADGYRVHVVETL